ncbi:hypothetical protein L3X38_008779 [Prunus dulcis]|uniref:DUF1985 domain-containing protein n=1 Tax=Prunus dulcis TaxID=3755 RepID=A0AAD4ZX76_PRUDU|nr:hypothetical protein L3X38_008779 [Prunus dulcis]
MIAEEENFQGKALSISHTKTAISTIKEKFSEQQLRRFEESCFGHLLLIEDLKWTSPIVHGLLMRKADPKIVSQVNGIKFIVGNKYFGNDKTVNLLELEKAFLDCADADNVLKLGFVYFAVFVLLGSETHVHIDMRYLKLAKDLEQFGKYPWDAVDVQLLRPSVIDKQRPYWTWGDSVDDTEKLAELFGDDAEQKTSTYASVEEKDEDIDETASLPCRLLRQALPFFH